MSNLIRSNVRQHDCCLIAIGSPRTKIWIKSTTTPNSILTDRPFGGGLGDATVPQRGGLGGSRPPDPGSAHTKNPHQ